MNVTYSKIGKRLGAYLLDNIIGGILGGIVAYIVVRQTEASIYMAGGDQYEAIGVGLIAYNIVMFLYYSIFEAGKKHATPGKRAVKIKVAGKDGSEVKTLDVLVRNAVKLLPALLSAILMGSAVASVISLVQIVYYIVPLCNKNHRAIHDFMGGTAVVLAENAAGAQNTAGADGAAVNVNVGANSYAATNSYAGAGSYAGPSATPSGIPSINIPITPMPGNMPQPGSMPQPGNMPPMGNMAMPADEQTVKPFHAMEDEKTVPPEFMKHTRKLVGTSGIYQGAELPLDQPIIMGREQNGCNLHFPENTGGVSRLHCKITAFGNGVRLEDLGSTYGVLVNQNRRLEKGEWVQLSAGETFTIGKNETFLIK